MSGTNGGTSPNDSATPDGELPDGAIDTTLETVENEVVDTRAIKAEQEAAELRQRLSAQQERINELVKTSTTQSEMLSELVGRSRGAEERGWAYEADRIRGIMRKAASEADQTTYDAAEQTLFSHMEHRPSAAELKRQAAQKNQHGDPAAANSPAQQLTPPDPAVSAWVAENSWINDRKMHREAMAVEANIMEDKPYLTTADRLKEVRVEMAKRHPDKFQNPARNQPPAVSRPGPQGGGKPKPKTKTAADLPEDAKLALARIKRRDPSFTDDDYIKSYKWDQ
jgi:hypothetical protein